jgi:YidC/Oxa1 family membrane protein insertase
MRSLIRLAIVLGAVVIFSGFPAPRAWTQAPQAPAIEGKPSPAFQKAAELAASDKLQDALAEYERVIKDNENKDLGLVTEARYRRASLLEKLGNGQGVLSEYAQVVRENRGRDVQAAAEALFQSGLYGSTRFGKTAAEKAQGEDTAHQTWKQLRDEYPDTVACSKLLAARPEAPEGLLAALDDRIDRRNSKHWQYQVIDVLVRLTGKNPSFSYALALILLAVLVKIGLWPLTIRQYASMREMQALQPLIKELQKKYQKAELQQKTMDLYKQHKVNPFAGCFTSLLQIPFLIMIFNAIRQYEIAFGRGHFLWIGSPMSHDAPRLMGEPILARSLAHPDVPLLAMYAVTNYVTMKLTPATDPQQQQQQNTMAVMMSGLLFWMFLTYKWSSAFVLYWLALNIFSIWQQYHYVFKPHKARMAAGKSLPTSAPAAEPSKNGGGRAEQVTNSLSTGTPPARVRPRKKKR